MGRGRSATVTAMNANVSVSLYSSLVLLYRIENPFPCPHQALNTYNILPPAFVVALHLSLSSLKCMVRSVNHISCLITCTSVSFVVDITVTLPRQLAILPLTSGISSVVEYLSSFLLRNTLARGSMRIHRYIRFGTVRNRPERIVPQP